jgi:signal transduction histidine kinase
MKPRKFFFTAPWLRGILESLLLGFLLFLLMDLFLENTGSDIFSIIVIVVLAGSYAGFRIRICTGERKIVIREEIKTAAVLCAGFFLVVYLAFGLVQIGGRPNPPYPDFVVDLFAFSFGAAVYLGWRILLWLWNKWDRMRRTKFVWSVMQVFALTILGIALIAILIILMFVILPGNIYQQTAVSSLPSQVLQRVFQFLTGMMVAMPLVMVPVLIMLLPPMALASYWMTRRLSRRLNQLEGAAHRLSQGDLSARSPMEGEDEIAHLQEDFNRMAVQLERSNQELIDERDRVSELLNAQRRLTASVSHELRTPVSIALAALENSLDEQANLTAENNRKNLETARHEITHLQKLIEDLFAVSKAELNHLNLRMAPTDLTPILQNVVNSMQTIAWKSGRVRVTAEIPGELPFVNADATRVEQVLINLLNNSVRHTPPGGFVIITVEVESENVRVSVIDSGDGISEEDLPHVWEPFYTADDNSGGDHTGLGLAIVKELVNSMGGEVTASSEPGQGSTFTFSLKNS